MAGPTGTGNGVAVRLTDGSGIGTFTVPKIIKDFIADALISAAAGLASVNIVAIPTDKAQSIVAAYAIGGAVIHALYRAVLKWATS
jgi:hypothetical protein